jgi:putative ABC transport system substrate-binding protein
VITRRRFLAVGAAGLICPTHICLAQQQRVYRVGVIDVRTAATATRRLAPFEESLRNLGYAEGKNLIIERRFADGVPDRLAQLAIELVRMKVDAILANSSFAVEAARQATSSVPIVMTGVGDPVHSRFVASLAHPGGNVTGLTNVSINVSSKYVELLHAAVPKLTRIAVLINPAHPNHPVVLKQIQAGASAIAVSVSKIDVVTIDQMGAALNAAILARAGALIVPPDPAFSIKEREIADFAINSRLPTLFGISSGVDAGGLMGYEPNVADMFHRAAVLVDKILRGAKPADLPVEFPTRFDLALNLKTAKALGLTIPQSLLVSADKVIE